MNNIAVKGFMIDNLKWLVFAAIILAFLSIGAFKLDLRVVMDEPWLSVPGYTLITQGAFSIPSFKDTPEGYDKILFVPPLQLLLLGAFFKMFGLGVVQGRLLSLIFGALTVFLTYLLAKQLYDERVALFASALLAADNYFFLVSRAIRGEIFVACFFLLSVYTLYIALKDGKAWLFMVSGVAIGLGILSHQNALLGLLPLVLMFYLAGGLKMIFNKGLYLFFGGLFLIMLPYLIYLLYAGYYFGYISIWRQLEMDARVLPIFSTAWLLASFKGEIFKRYADFIYFPSRLHIALIYFAALIYGFYRRSKSDVLLLTIVCSYVLLFYFLVVNKNVRYLVNFLPFVCILTSSVIFGIFEGGLVGRHKKMLPYLLIGFVIVSQLVGTLLFFVKYADSGYNNYMRQINTIVPAGASVYGPITYWFGLYQHEYYAYQRVTFPAARDRYKAQVFIVEDKVPESYVNQTGGMKEYFARKGVLLGEVDNSFYGQTKIYRTSQGYKGNIK